MKIKDIMVSNVITAKPGDSVLDVADILFSNRFHGLPVTENGKVVGIITEDDFFLKNFDDLFLPSYIRFIKENKIADNVPANIQEKIKKLLDAKATDIMTPNCLTVNPEMDVEELMKTIHETKFTTFPVADQEKNLLGIVTLSDILGTVKQGSKEMARAMSQNGKDEELNKLAEELGAAWKDNLVIMSKKSVHTWKGIVIISIVAALGIIILAIVNANLKNTCGLTDQSLYPLTCQRFTYSDWGTCQANGTETRSLLKKMPQNCEGGAPELVQPCTP
jgi:acetoin utilization protein AcuB